MVNDINEILNFVESCKEEGTLPNEEVICPECSLFLKLLILVFVKM